MARWTEALQSWNTFCSTQSDFLFTVPPGLDFNLSQFKFQMCSVDVMKLIDEFTQSQGIDELIDLVSEFYMFNALVHFIHLEMMNCQKERKTLIIYSD